MFRKIGYIMAALLLFSGLAQAYDPTRDTGLWVGSEATQPSTFVKWDLGCYGNFHATIPKVDVWIDLAAADSDTIRQVSISTATLNGATTTWTEAMARHTQWAAPRNLSLTVWNKDVAGTDIVLTSATLVGTLTVVGYDARFNSISEVITATCAAKTFAGEKAFSRVTSYTIAYTAGSPDLISLATHASMYFGIGIGNVIGLSGNITDSEDIYMINEAGTAIKYDNTSLAIDTDYDTIDFVTNPTGTGEYTVRYLGRTLY